MGSSAQLTRLFCFLFAALGSSTEWLTAGASAQEKAAEQAVWLAWESDASSREDATGPTGLKLLAAEVVNLGAAQFELSFPAEVWEFSNVSTGPLLSSALLESNLIEPGRVKVAFVSSESIDGTGTLIQLEFRRRGNQASADLIRLENFRAWRQADSSDSGFTIRPSVGPTNTTVPSVPEPTTATPASSPAPTTPLNSPVVVAAPAPESRFPETFTVKLELPGWLWFIAGTCIGLLAGILLGRNLQRSR